jgi:hypothetical protein
MVSIFAIAIALVSFMPAVWDFYYQEDLWINVSDQGLAIRDNIYQIFQILPLFMIGSVLLWMYLNSGKKDYSY